MMTPRAQALIDRYQLKEPPALAKVLSVSQIILICILIFSRSQDYANNGKLCMYFLIHEGG